MGTHTGNVVTLANSIIGVSVLAMPFCFKQCGIILSILMLLFSNIISRLACHYLMKSAILEKRKNFEMLAFRVFGSAGKLMVELCMIGFLLGTCIAFFIIIGDLGPGILGPSFGFQHPSALRPSVLIAIAIFVILPLGLLKNVDSLSSICAVTVAFYGCLVVKVLGEAIEHLLTADWVDKVYYWRPSGMLQCIPIFSMALSCQPQLFEIFDSLLNTPLERMNSVVRSATNMVTFFYICVGFFGYIAFCDQPFTGNLMMSFSKTITSDVVKIGFLLSVAVSFPLVIFPCRASIHSLLFSKGYEHAQTGSAYIPETRFQCITLIIVTMSLVIGLLIPNIELVLGLVGSTIGVIICVIVPAILFLSLSSKNNNERLLAKGLVFIGLVIMVLGTYANLYATDEAMSSVELKPASDLREQPSIPKIILNNDVSRIKDETLKNLKNVEELAAALPKLEPKLQIKVVKEDEPKTVSEKGVIDTNFEKVKDIKKEPPVPEEPMLIQKKIMDEGLIANFEKVKDTKKEPAVPEEPLESKNDVIPKFEISPKDVKDIPSIGDTPKDDNFPKVAIPAKVNPDSIIDLMPKINPDVINGNNPLAKEIKVKEVIVENDEKKINEGDKMIESKKDNKIQKEVLMKKIIENQHAQEKLIAKGEELLQEFKMVVKDNADKNHTRDSIIDEKSGTNKLPLEGAKEEKKEDKVKLIESNVITNKDHLVASMAKGVPLPLVKGKLKLPVLEKNNLVNVTAEKVSSDILAPVSKEQREKRDLDEVLSQNSSSDLVNAIASLARVKVPEIENLKENSETQLVPDFVKDAKPEKETCEKNATAGSTAKNEDVKLMKINNKTDKSPTEIKLELIKFSSKLSDPKQILDASPKLLDNQAKSAISDSVIGEMPKKRDLKSIETNDMS